MIVPRLYYRYTGMTTTYVKIPYDTIFSKDGTTCTSVTLEWQGLSLYT
jgi:hypothetical protein